MLFAISPVGMLFSILLATITPTPLLTDGVNGQPAANMTYARLVDMATEQLGHRSERFETLTSPQAILEYQHELRARFLESLGDFPDKTPLNAQVVERGERELFRYEKIIFESQPGLFVTGLLFLPKTDGPWPGVIVPCGHSENGKAMDAYQRVSILLAINGMAAFCYDPIGQGERYTYLKEDGTPEFGATLEHCLLGVGAILTGTNTARYRIWDGMRAVDYLCSRNDILPDKIGCTGNSGGGTLTSYLMALDDRILCAAPSCYITSFDRLLNTIGPQDAEQNIFGQLAFGMDHADYLVQRAPRPTLICAATKDFFDISGTWDAYRQAKRVYSTLGWAEKVDLIENNDQHGYAKPQREAAVRWMRRWLLDDYQPIVEPDFDVFTNEEAKCTPQGQVMRLKNARSMLDLTVERADQLIETRNAFLDAADKTTLLAKVRELNALPSQLPNPPDVEILHQDNQSGNALTTMLLRPEPGIVLPAILAVPPACSGKYVLLLDEQGNAHAFAPDGAAAAALQEGHAVFTVELRGIGETQASQEPKGWHDYIGSNWQDVFLAYLLGKSMVGLRVMDVIAAWQCLNSQLKPGESIGQIQATGAATIPALHAVVLYPELFGTVSLHLKDTIPSWDDAVRAPRAKHQLVNAIHNALAWYDLPNLKSLLAPNQLTEENTHMPTF